MKKHIEAPSEEIEVGDTPEETQKALALVFKRVAAGRLDHVVGRELAQMIKTRLGYYKHEHDVSELAQLRELVRRAQEVHDEGVEQETADRQHTKILKKPNDD